MRHEDKMETFFLVSLCRVYGICLRWRKDDDGMTERNVEVFVLAVFGRRYDTVIE